MATYKIYMRSFAPWREFGTLVPRFTMHVYPQRARMLLFSALPLPVPIRWRNA